MKKACKGVSYPKTSSVSKRLGSSSKKAKSGTSLGMKSIQAGYDKNPGVTRADFVSIGKGEAKKGAKVKKAQTGVKQEYYAVYDPKKATLATKAVSDTSGFAAGKKRFESTYTDTKGRTSSGTVSRREVKRMIKKPRQGAHWPFPGDDQKKPKAQNGKMKKCKYGCK